MADKSVKRVWVQKVAVAAQVLESRLEVAESRGLAPDQKAAADGVRALLDKARDAAFRRSPAPGRLTNWWRGTLADTAFQHLHAARAELVDVYDEAELAAEIPGAVARAQSGMHRDDPRQISPAELLAMPTPIQRAVLRRFIADGYDASDQLHERLRSFRNVVLMSFVAVTLLVGVAAVVVGLNPNFLPLCFGTGNAVDCPTGTGAAAPAGSDIAVVALLGLLGGALAGALSIRNLRGTSTPYDVPVALALLKLPLGAMTAVIGLVFVRAAFVPGLSALDSQAQILAYAVLFGFAQQLFTRLVDQRAQTLMESLPAKDSEAPAPLAPAPAPVPVAVPVPATVDESLGDGQFEPSGRLGSFEPDGIPLGVGAPESTDDFVAPGDFAEPGDDLEPDDEFGDIESGTDEFEAEDFEGAEPEFLPNPLGDDEEQVQDDEDDDIMPDAPHRDGR